MKAHKAERNDVKPGNKNDDEFKRHVSVHIKPLTLKKRVGEKGKARSFALKLRTYLGMFTNIYIEI